MPVIENIRNGAGQIALWSPEEEVPALLERLSFRPDWQHRAAGIVLEKRKKEFLIPRVLLCELCGPTADIVYTPDGRPLLEPAGRGYISISHTGSCMALAFHPAHPIGVDVEQISDKILRIAPRVLTPRELAFLSKGDEAAVHALLCWSAKESLFKVIGVPEISFCDQLHIEPFCPEAEGTFGAWESRTDAKVRYTVHYKVYAQFVLTYCIRE